MSYTNSCYKKDILLLRQNSGALFYFAFEGDFQGFLRLEFLGAYTWRGLFSEFYGIPPGSRVCTNETESQTWIRQTWSVFEELFLDYVSKKQKPVFI